MRAIAERNAREGRLASASAASRTRAVATPPSTRLPCSAVPGPSLTPFPAPSPGNEPPSPPPCGPRDQPPSSCGAMTAAHGPRSDRLSPGRAVPASSSHRVRDRAPDLDRTPHQAPPTSVLVSRGTCLPNATAVGLRTSHAMTPLTAVRRADPWPAPRSSSHREPPPARTRVLVAAPAPRRSCQPRPLAPAGPIPTLAPTRRHGRSSRLPSAARRAPPPDPPTPAFRSAYPAFRSRAADAHLLTRRGVRETPQPAGRPPRRRRLRARPGVVPRCPCDPVELPRRVPS